MVSAYFRFFVALLLVRTAACGQLFTNGLSIIDAPSAQSPAHAGSVLPIAVEVSGNGQLSADAANPNSTLPTHISLLEIYLVSDNLNLNVTVSSGTGFLTGESGSVRHLNWPVPTCIPQGQFNLTFYETSEVNGVYHFTITAIPLPVLNPTGSSGNCTQVNPLQQQPQASSPLAQSPFLSNSQSGLLTITISDGSFQFPTVTKTVAPTTVVVVSMETLTTTVTGQQGVVTSLFTQTFTTTAVMQQSDTSGFLPVNSSQQQRCSHFLLYWSLVVCILALYHW